MPEYIKTPDLSNVARLAQMAAQTRTQGVLNAVQGLLSGAQTYQQNVQNKKEQQATNPMITITPEFVSTIQNPAMKAAFQSLVGKPIRLGTAAGATKEGQNFFPADEKTAAIYGVQPNTPIPTSLEAAGVRAQADIQKENIKNPKVPLSPEDAKNLGLSPTPDNQYNQSTINNAYKNALNKTRTQLLNSQIKHLDYTTKQIEGKIPQLDEAHKADIKTSFGQASNIMSNVRNGVASDNDKQAYSQISQHISSMYGVDLPDYDSLATPGATTIFNKIEQAMNDAFSKIGGTINRKPTQMPQPKKGATQHPNPGQGTTNPNDPMGIL